MADRQVRLDLDIGLGSIQIKCQMQGATLAFLGKRQDYFKAATSE